MAKEKLTLVPMLRGEEYLMVHPTCVESHKAAGYVLVDGITPQLPPEEPDEKKDAGEKTEGEKPEAGKTVELPADGKKE
jgi:hypothetical protein